MMWWKRGFVILLSFNLLVVVGVLIVWNTFPAANRVPATPIQTQHHTQKQASIQLVIGQDAINSYLNYAVSKDPDVHNIVRSAHIEFSSTWACDVGVIVLGRTVPFHMVLLPVVVGGNLVLQVQQASMGLIPIPDSLLFPVLQHAKWPGWIRLDSAHHAIRLNFTQRPQNPFGIRVIQYSNQTQQLTLQLTMSPKTVLG